MITEDFMVFTEEQARLCVESAQPGQSFVYVIGYLPVLCSADRPDAFRRFGTVKQIRRMADYMRRAGSSPYTKDGILFEEDGLSLGVLSQRKIRDFVYQYIFTRKKPTG